MKWMRAFWIAALGLVLGHLSVSAEEAAPDVAGKYYLGDGLGVNNDLVLNQDKTFSFVWKGCLGTYDENEGPYAFDKGVLVLSPKRENVCKGFRGTPTRFLPIAWGDRLYLIPEDQMMDFVNEINQGGEPREVSHGYFYLREGDEKKAVEGFPRLPAPWQDLLLKAPLLGQVVKVSGRKTCVVNLGKSDGLKVGMHLTARDTKDTRFTQLKVVSVGDKTAKAEVLYQDGVVSRGDIVSTRFH